MFSISRLLLAAAVAACACGTWAAPAPAGWTQGPRASGDAQLSLLFAVKLASTQKLTSELHAVSDPASPRFGQHLSKAEADSLVTPDSSALEAVKGFLAQHGLEGTPLGSGEYVSVTVPVAKAEEMLGAEYYTWTAGDATVTRSVALSLPAALAGAVDFVSPTTGFPSARTPVPQVAYRGRRLRGLSSTSYVDDRAAAEVITPSVIGQVYGTADATTQGNLQGNKVAVAQFLGQFYSPDDLEAFFQDFVPTAEGRKPTVYGPNDAGSPGVEASLDIQYAMGVASHVPTDFFSTPGQQPGSPENEPFLTWLTKLGGFSDGELPQVVSVSYGDNEDTVLFDYAVRVNVEFQRLGARGVTFLFSSGDGGVAGSQTTPCTDFIPTFPAASPYVTAVGGTRRISATGEVAASLSSGGFSNYWPRPAYQDEAVAAYKANMTGQLPPAAHFNQTGAGFPDVAAFAENFQVVYKGSTIPVAGTSCASPTFAAVLSLVNGARMVQGKGSLGWINPWLYKNGHLFTDIVSGNNPGCGSPGFYASAGWDPITGWGSPNYNKLVDALVFDRE